MDKREENVPPGFHVIFVKWITRKGVRVYPPRGQKAWKLVVRDRRQSDS
jgi:hypothetical protein